jgi:hypothetical protein
MPTSAAFIGADQHNFSSIFIDAEAIGQILKIVTSRG